MRSSAISTGLTGLGVTIPESAGRVDDLWNVVLERSLKETV
ncbi:MAG: hypothetical protein DK306_001906 [Chloroflexi bacterium]|jgi:hypothetical protein|nr:MAG: hypothetical protein DK306_001906 [Chloroflexota bacterium]